MQFLTRLQVRSIDQLAIERLGIPGLVLMENAGRNAAAHILPQVTPDSRVAILVGPGNNGGDGYVIARHLAIARIPITLYSSCPLDRLTGDARINADIAQRLNIPIRPMTTSFEIERAGLDWPACDLIVDALLGTGFQGDVRPAMAQIIQRCNSAQDMNIPVVAIDIPSGLDADTGHASPESTIIANLTITFVAAKIGFRTSGAKPYLGKVVVESIGLPEEWIERVLV